MKITEENILKKSGELGIPFRNLMAGVLLELTAGRLFEGSFSRSVCIINDGDLSVEAYKKKAPLVLSLYYFLRGRHTEGVIAGRPVNGEVLGLMASELFPAEDRDGLRWKADLGGKEIYAVGFVEKYEIPIEIKLREVPETAFICIPREMKYSLDEFRSTLIMTYPAEMRVADDLFEILDKLELLGEISAYYEVYESLHRDALNGRKVQERLIERSRERNAAELPFSERMNGRFEMLQRYVNHKTMQKKWRSFLRVNRLAGPSWEEVLSTVTEFLAPILGAACRGDIFFEDWMPELGRFM